MSNIVLMVSVRRIRTVFTGVAGSPWYVNMHFTSAGASTPQDQVQAVLDFWTAEKTYLNQGLRATVQGDVAEVDVATGKQTGVISTTGGFVDMAATAAALPTVNQALIRLRSSAYVNGRQVQGRIFIPGLSFSCIENGKVKPAFAASLTTQATALITAGLAIYSKTGSLVSTVASASVWQEFSVLRSRRD